MADKTLDKRNEQLDDTPWGHKWGFKDTRFILQPDRSVTVTGGRYAISGTEMPEFIPFVEEMLGVTIDPDDLKPEVADKPVPPPQINDAFFRALQNTFPEMQYSQENKDRLLHSHGQTTVDEVYQVLYNRLERVTDLVFYPESEDDVVNLITLAARHDVCLVPFGGGTSVSCALKLPDNETRMIVVVDMRRMNKILWLDRENYRASIQAGISGKQLEEELEKMGFTSGHEPDSLELSTLGGWIATNASGMKKNRYGNIEDMVENFTLVTPRGVIEQKVAMPRISIGMQPNKLLFGNEGNLGIITKAEIRIHKLPEAKKYGSVVFPTFEDGTKFLYELTRTGVLPASVRLVDNFQFRFGSALRPRPTAMGALVHKLQKFFLLNVKGFDPHQMCAATLVMEGSKSEVAYQEKLVYGIAKKHGGIAGGEGNGKRGYMLTYAIAYIRDFMADYYVTGETYETTVPWDKIDAVIKAVDQVSREQHELYGLPGKPYVSPRITQLYHTGVCIYFTHGFSGKGVDNPDQIFSKIEHALRETIMEHGGSVSHHHGIGKLRRDFMPETLSETSIELLRDIKQAHDPQNIFGIRNNVFAE
jgi:alkyldihydroxyacetonephosphate synthase